MTTARAIIIAAVILAVVGAATAYLVTPRYSLTNPGQGVTIRLDRAGGDMIGCERLACRQIVKGSAPVADPAALPPGFVLDNAH